MSFCCLVLGQSGKMGETKQFKNAEKLQKAGINFRVGSTILHYSQGEICCQVAYLHGNMDKYMYSTQKETHITVMWQFKCLDG